MPLRASVGIIQYYVELLWYHQGTTVPLRADKCPAYPCCYPCAMQALRSAPLPAYRTVTVSRPATFYRWAQHSPHPFRPLRVLPPPSRFARAKGLRPSDENNKCLATMANDTIRLLRVAFR